MNKKLKASMQSFNYRLIFVILGLVVFSRPMSAAGELDSSLGSGGIVYTQFPNTTSTGATDIVIQPDGKSVVSVLVRGQSNFDLAIIRYNSDGTLDTSFSGDGIFNTPFGSDLDIIQSVALQPDGKIVAAGALISGQSGGFLTLRLNANGTLDPTFDGDGIAVNGVFNAATADVAAIQADGKILVAGNAFNNDDDFFAVIRLNSNGSLDTTFGDNGKAVVSFSAVDFISDMKLQPDGKILLLGNADLSSENPYPALVRFNSNGTLDTTFDGDGKVTAPNTGIDVTALALQTDGKILISGSKAGDFAILRYNPDGSLDSGFDGDGIALVSFGGGSAANDLTVQPDNRIILAGETANANFFDLDFAAARLNPNGSPDATFGSGGKTVTRIGDGFDSASAVALQPNGKITLAGAGTRLGSTQTALVRYLNQTQTRIQTKFDFDGDGKADVSVFRPSNGAWYVQGSTAGLTGINFGSSSDKIVPADYDGDGKTDVAVYRNGTWYLQLSQLGFTGISFGTAEDIPAPADFDGDGKADLAVFRPSNGTWYINGSTVGFYGVTFGQNGDQPVAADYDGDGKADIAVYRAGVWYLNRSSAGFTGVSFGTAGDTVVPADYDGDGKTDLAVFRSSIGTWYLQQSTAGFAGVQFGANGDAPTPADYDGDGKADLGVFRGGAWYINRSTAGFTGVNFGSTGDLAIPNAYVR